MRVRHRHQADHVQHRAGHHHAPGAEAVRDHSRERLGHAPHQVLQRDGEREDVPSPAVRIADRLQKQAE
jgi:hypothetical protein